MHPRPGSRVEARKRHRRGNWIAAAAILFATAVLALVVTSFLMLSQQLGQKDSDIDRLAAQVKSLGGTPVAGPRGATGATGIVGPSGSPGPSGASGKPGKDAPTLTPSPGPSGPAGPSGVPGADSTVPGPTGASGQDGATGASGKDGSNGSPPSSWTYTDQYGNTYRCTPVDDFDPDNPKYTCTQTATAEPTSSTTPSPSPQPSDSMTPLLPLGLLTLRRT